MNIRSNKWVSSFILLKLVIIIFCSIFFELLTKQGDLDIFTTRLDSGGHPLTDGTDLMVEIGIAIRDPLFANLIFGGLSLFLCFLVLKYCINNLHTVHFRLIYMAMLVPNYLLWTSQMSKESFFQIVFFFALLALNSKHRILAIPFLYFSYVMKFQYFIPFLLTLRLFKRTISNFYTYYILSTLSLVAIFVLAYDNFDVIEKFAVSFAMYFDGGGSARDTSWNDVSDFAVDFIIYPIPFFIGPLITDITKGPLYLISFIEGIFQLILLIYMFVSLGQDKYAKRVFVLVVISLVYLHFPFSAFNIGAGIRYKQALWTTIIVIFITLCKGKSRKCQG
ncbi:hypothetical protein H5300_16155 [Vibrio sp. SG41-7]|uniref:hypothetical protein n=1 Tax=Vibrio sp. SG41-7 TaxID=2760973 RepID=UPI0015FF2CF7|nr:hypothetical protein [Vibrio sp. SG41-7]MBB1464847.1 hypothetical protein [Vibrio sp. SG41-7]